MCMRLREQPLPPANSSQAVEVPRTLQSLAGVQGMGQSPGSLLGSPDRSGFYTPVKAEPRAPHCLLLQRHLDASQTLSRETLSCFLRTFSDKHSYRT